MRKVQTVNFFKEEIAFNKKNSEKILYALQYHEPHDLDNEGRMENKHEAHIFRYVRGGTDISLCIDPRDQETAKKNRKDLFKKALELLSNPPKEMFLSKP